MKHFYRSLNVELPDKEDVKRLTPNPATREMIDHLSQQGKETYLERFQQQHPLCSYGLRGLCCRLCLMGPCRLSKNKPRGICGLHMNAAVMGNILRALAAGCAAHGQHTREVIETLKLTAEGKTDFNIMGEERVWELAKKFNLKTQGKSLNQTAGEIAQILLEDLSRVEDRPMQTLLALAPQERIQTWQELDIIPRSAFYEIVESLHQTTLGTNSDWKSLARQDLRTSLAYCWSAIFGSNLATEMLFGVPQPKSAEVNYGVLKEGYVNILLHGHSPLFVEKVVENVKRPQVQELAKQVGAKGIQLGGMCCTGLELLARHGIPTVANVLGQELVIGTGAVDAVIVDMQCILPGLKLMADCFGTEVITTCKSNRIPGATHIPFDPEKADEVALKAIKTAVQSYTRRDHSAIFIPKHKTRVMAGYSFEAILHAFDGAENLLNLLKSGDIKGIVTLVSCNTPKVPYEYSQVTLATELVKRGMLLTTTGCCAHALLNAGLCSLEAAELAPEGLKRICRERHIPPVLSTGACVDNTRTIRLFIELARAADLPIYRMPFFFSGPEPSNEKSVGAGMSFLTLGVSIHQGFPAPLPVPVPKPKEGATQLDDYDPDRNDVVDFFTEGITELLQANVYSEPYPELAAGLIQMHIRRKRLALGWK